MANEFRHKDVVAGKIYENEYENINQHIFNSQATGDMMIASSASQLSRLAITNDRVLVSSGGLPVWSNTLPAFTLGGTVTLNGQIFDAGSGNAVITTTGQYAGLTLRKTNDAADGIRFIMEHLSSSQANNDVIAEWHFNSYDSVSDLTRFGKLLFRSTVITDGSEAGTWEFYGMDGAGAENLAMTLSGAGGLSVDADIGTADDPVALFDSIPAKYGVDDAQFLARYAISDMMPALCDIGVMERKDTGSGYMINVQKASYLSWGAIRHLNQRVEDLESKLSKVT